MREQFNRRAAWPAGLGMLLIGLVGCSRQQSYKDYIPSADKARGALEQALTAWQKGQSPGFVETETGGIQVMDSRWQAGDKLASFRIVDPEPGGEGPTWFKVKLTMKEPAGDKDVRYVVIGQPKGLWVYREEDYKKLSGM